MGNPSSSCGVEAVPHAPFQVVCKVHPGFCEGIQVLREAPARKFHAVKSLEHTERAGKRDSEVPGPPATAPVVYNNRGPDLERERDSVSFPRIYRRRLRDHPADCPVVRGPPLDPFKRGCAAAGCSRMLFEFPGYGFRDYDPV